MKKITKSILVLSLLFCGALIANAQEDEVKDFDETFYHSWSEVSATAVDNGVSPGVVKIGEEVALGGTIWGNSTGAVPYLYYANISEYSELRFEGTPGAVLRLMCNRTVNEGPIFEFKPTIGEDGKLTVKISDLKYLNGGTACDFVCLQSIKVPAGWQGGTTACTLTSIKIVKPADPLSIPKESLKNAINDGKKQNSVGKTTASFSALTTAISDGETELANGEATAESLAAAAKKIIDAISGLELAEGWFNMTKSIFKTWDSHSALDGTVNAGCAYDINKLSDMIYGLSTVDWLNYVNLSYFDKLVIVMNSGRPRFCFNRIENGGQDNEDKSLSKMIDIPNKSWGTAAYQSVEGNVYTIDVAKMASEEGFSHLHCIKGLDGSNVAEMLIYAAPQSATIGAAGYATFATDKAVKFEGVEAYVATINGSSLTLTAVTEVPANTAVILKGADTYSFPVIDAAAAVGANDLKVSDGTVTGDKIYVLAKPEDKEVGFYLLDSSKKVPAGKAYIQLPADAPALDFIGFGSETTGINDVRSKMADVRGDFFDLQGRKVANPTKGLYIVNGKKVAIK